MPTLSSRAWIIDLDLCTKHHSHLPCPECLATQDKDIAVNLTMYDTHRRGCKKTIINEDMFTDEYKWMYERMMN